MRIGDLVEHRILGMGVIYGMSNGYYEVLFPSRMQTLPIYKKANELELVRPAPRVRASVPEFAEITEPVWCWVGNCPEEVFYKVRKALVTGKSGELFLAPSAVDTYRYAMPCLESEVPSWWYTVRDAFEQRQAEEANS